ncbi:MAG: hypothetical protein M3438_09435 [Pseudomonadota bacterium]|nr:hypothetical protein [Sphingomonas sp.]MDQ3479363.1 hypothetical protein [Pseudomonadota bacterium]
MTVSPLRRAEARAHQAIEVVYQAFVGPVPASIEGCPCCIDTRGVDVLISTPLRQISGDALWQYVSGVFYTVGSGCDFRYLLPRILEVDIHEPGNSNDPEIVLTKLGLANWLSWTECESRAIEGVVDAWFELALARDVAEADGDWIGHEAESVLCGASRAGFSLQRWLIRLHQPDAAPVLTDLKERYPDELSAFWEEVPEGFKEFATILSQGQS